MKIVYLITKSEIGGAQVHLLSLIKYAREKTHEVHLIVGSDGWMKLEAQKLGAKTYINQYVANSFNPIRALKAILLLRKTINKINPDIVHAHSGAAGFLGRISLLGKFKTVFTAHGWSFTPGAPALRRIFAVVAEKLSSFFTDKIICVSKFDYNLAKKYAILKEEDLVQIYNAVEIPTNFIREDKEKLEILFIGRLAMPKNLPLFFRAFSDLPKDIQAKANIKIIGDGPLMEECKESAKGFGISSSVSFLGTTTRGELGTYLQSADIFVLPTLWEGFPMTILEAMSYGVPVIASSAGGIPEIVDESVGALVDKNNIKGFTDKLSFLILNKEEREKRGQNARKLIEEKFTLQEMLGKTFALYSDLVSENNLNSFQDNSNI